MSSTGIKRHNVLSRQIRVRRRINCPLHPCRSIGSRMSINKMLIFHCRNCDVLQPCGFAHSTCAGAPVCHIQHPAPVGHQAGMPTFPIPFPGGTWDDYARRGRRTHSQWRFLPWLYSQNQPFYDLAYADDTALLAGTATRAQQLLHTLQAVASHSNLRLNLKKCILLRSPTSHKTDHLHKRYTCHHRAALQVPWRNAQQIRLHPQRHVTTRLAKARKHFHSLHQFWRNTDVMH